MWLAPLDEAGQSPQLGELFYEVPDLGTFLHVLPNILVVTAPKGRVSTRLLSSRARETNEFQVASLI